MKNLNRLLTFSIFAVYLLAFQASAVACQSPDSSGAQKGETKTEAAQISSADAVSNTIVDRLGKAKFVDAEFDEVAKKLKGKLVGLYFTAAWCGPCKVFTPQLQEFRDANSDDFAFVVMSLDKDLESQQKYLQSSAIKAPAVMFDDEITRALMKEYQFGGIPTLLVFTPNGHLITDQGAKQIRTILEEKLDLADDNPAEKRSVEQWQGMVSGWQDRIRNADAAEKKEIAAAQIPIYARYALWQKSLAIQDLGPRPDEHQLRTVLADIGKSIVEEWETDGEKQLDNLRRLAIDLAETYPEEVGPLYWEATALIREVSQASKDKPGIYKVFSQWRKQEWDYHTASWGLRGMAACAVAGNKQAIADIKNLDLTDLGGDTWDLYELLKPGCEAGSVSIIKLVGSLYAQSSYWDYAAIATLQAPARKGQADALEIIKLISTSGEHEATRQAAAKLLKEIPTK